MGNVYCARDMKLERTWRLKVLGRTGRRWDRDSRRFEEEARAASGLSHPNIVTIYGVGEASDVCVHRDGAGRGGTLRALARGGRAAGAGARASPRSSPMRSRPRTRPDRPSRPQAGQRDGHAPTGWSRCSTSASPSVHRPVEARGPLRERDDLQRELTDDGLILGTVGYMSPEQATGGAVDHRSDQFSFGAILYELLSGRRAFERSTRAATIAAIAGRSLPRFHAGRRPGGVETGGEPVPGEGSVRTLRDHTRPWASVVAIQAGWQSTSRFVVSRRRAMWLAASMAIVGVSGVAVWRYWPAALRLAVLPPLPIRPATTTPSISATEWPRA